MLHLRPPLGGCVTKLGGRPSIRVHPGYGDGAGKDMDPIVSGLARWRVDASRIVVVDGEHRRLLACGPAASGVGAARVVVHGVHGRVSARRRYGGGDARPGSLGLRDTAPVRGSRAGTARLGLLRERFKEGRQPDDCAVVVVVRTLSWRFAVPVLIPEAIRADAS